MADAKRTSEADDHDCAEVALDVIAVAVRRVDLAEVERDVTRGERDKAWEDRRAADLELEREKQRRAPERDVLRSLWKALNGEQRANFRSHLTEHHRKALDAVVVWREETR